jgi:hypothetical protein
LAIADSDNKIGSEQMIVGLDRALVGMQVGKKKIGCSRHPAAKLPLIHEHREIRPIRFSVQPHRTHLAVVAIRENRHNSFLYLTLRCTQNACI